MGKIDWLVLWSKEITVNYVLKIPKELFEWVYNFITILKKILELEL
jgi:hypothetical protein